MDPATLMEGQVGLSLVGCSRKGSLAVKQLSLSRLRVYENMQVYMNALDFPATLRAKITVILVGLFSRSQEHQGEFDLQKRTT